ncbi:extracellular solute-binding protein [Lachnospiraceae bacterium ASD3451]|uniref:sugar ABC transporter substrate-binding protein n=1 Tax=Diplocloster agilis TaxID=2850323 RepID=UPI001D889626|nr:extracellular solute-binding protein [Diplocloster agilis]MBU9747003.1 extracellular solute-binding protein [Diplocloster agilis]
MGKFWKKGVSALVVILVLTELLLFSYHIQETEEESQPENEGKEAAQLTLWYSDENMGYYFTEAAKAYEQDTGIKVTARQVSGVDYIEQINKASISETGGPDLYMSGSDILEKAHLAGLASENQFAAQLYNSEHYPQIALDAVTYKGVQVAYPLSFETSCLLYNKAYAAEAPATIDDILTFSDTFEGGEGIENIFVWNVSDIFSDYFFAGNYINLGGPCGDDKAQIDINNEQVQQAMAYYQSLKEFFALDPETISDEDVIQDFMDGKTIYAIVRADDLNKMEAAASVGLTTVDYGVARVPDLTESLQTKPLAVTSVVVVNGYTPYPKEAADFAKYLTYDYAVNLYSMVNRMSARSDLNLDKPHVDTLKEIYQTAAGVPKIMELSNYWIQMEVTFANIWQGADVPGELQKVSDLITKQLK